MATARSRDAAVDTMRGVAIVMVIGIHSLPHSGSVAIAIDAVLRPCVPVFLFASGYLSASAPRIPLARRLKRALVPYTIAFFAAYLFMALSNPAMDHRPLIIVARYSLAYVFVYYYVFVYAGCTVLLWLLFALAEGGGRERPARLVFWSALAVVVGLAAGAYLDPLLQRLHVSAALIEEARMRDLPFWFAFVALGLIVGATGARQTLRQLRLPLAGLTIAAYAAYAAVRIAGLGDAADYDSLAFFLYAGLFCLTLLALDMKRPTLAMLGAASYFIYLWHIFVIMLLREAPALQLHEVAGSFIKFTAALAVSAALVVLLRRSAPPRLAHWLGA